MAVYEICSAPGSVNDVVVSQPIALTPTDIANILGYLKTVYGAGTAYNGSNVGYDSTSNQFYYTQKLTVYEA